MEKNHSEENQPAHNHSDSYRQAEDFLLDESFNDYCRGRSATAIHYWNNWLQEHPDKTALFQEATRLFHLVSGHDPEHQLAFDTFRKDLYAQPVTIKRRFTLVHMLAAAVVTCIIASGAWLYSRSVPAAAMATIVQYDTIHTKTGEIHRINLPDHSTVILNGNSSLVVPRNYPVNRRLILKGEGFFDVTPDAVHPFAVTSGGIESKVLGTSFNIQAYAQCRDIKITLATGRIAVKHADSTRQLVPGQQLVVSGNKQSMMAVNVEDYRKWIHGEMFFKNQTLGDMAVILQARFKATFVFNDNYTSKLVYNASFDRKVNLDKVLELLSYKRNIQFIHKGDTVWVHKAG